MTSTPANLQPGDLLCTNITGEVGKLIGLGEWLDTFSFKKLFNRELLELRVFSHVAVIRDSATLIEAEAGGARVAPIAEYLDGRPLMFSTGLLGIDKATGQLIANYAEAMVGSPYSFLDYGAIAAKRLHLPVPGLKDYINSSSHVICSQLAALAYDKAGKSLFPGYWPGYTTPLDVARLLVSKGAKP